MNNERAKVIANFRYSLISSIVSRENLYPGEITNLIRETAKKTYNIPYSNKTKVSTRTIERYLQAYRKGGYNALMPRNKISIPSRIATEYIDQAIILKKESPTRSILQIIEILEMSGKVPKGVLKKSTLYDHFKKHGLTKELGKKESATYQRFSPKHRNQRWQGDTCHLLYLHDPNNPKKKQKIYLIAWLDEYSRIIPHAQCYVKENKFTLEDSLKKGIIKYGIPEQIYVDNGSIYSSKHLESICAKLSIHLSHTRPYKPQGRGKLERFFYTVQRSFLPEIYVLLRDKALTLDELNEYFFVWLRQHYHEKLHSATKQRPRIMFESDTNPLKRKSLEEIYDAFLVEDYRTVDKTGIISLNAKEYQAQLELKGKKVLVRYDPYDISSTQIYYDGNRYQDATILEIPEHVDKFSKENNTKEKKEIEPIPFSGLNYLTFLKEKDEKGVSYTNSNE